MQLHEINDDGGKANKIAYYKIIGACSILFIFIPKIVLYVWAFELIGMALLGILYIPYIISIKIK